MARPVRPAWSALPRRALAFRLAHVAWGALAMSALGYIWFCAVTRRRDRLLYAATAFLLVQGAALVVGRGNCPFGPFQSRLGDPVPMFELVLPPRAAKAAIPALTIVALAGMVLAIVRQPPKVSTAGGAGNQVTRRQPSAGRRHRPQSRAR